MTDHLVTSNGVRLACRVDGPADPATPTLVFANSLGTTLHLWDRILPLLPDRSGLLEVEIAIAPGVLSDHYSPQERILRLSPEVYHGRSAAAVGVAARRSATKSAIVKSVSCPTPLITGASEAKIVRATPS